MQTAQSNSEVLVDPDTLSPETGEPFSRAMTARYLVAFVIFAILNCAAFVLNGNTLMPQHLKDLGYNETEATTALGTITSLTAIVGLLSGYVWGAFSATPVPASASARHGSSPAPSWLVSACTCSAPLATCPA